MRKRFLRWRSGHKRRRRYRFVSARCSRSAVEGFDAQVLFDPLEKQFDLPATAIKLGNGHGGEIKIVGQKREALASFGVAILHPAQLFWIGGGRLLSIKLDGLVADET